MVNWYKRLGLAARNTPRLKNKVVWLTGASSGIGEALAYALNREGANLILSGRDLDALLRVRENCRGESDGTILLPFDLADLGTLPSIAEEAMRAFGRIDILINNAGIGQFSPAIDTTLEVDQTILRVNFLAQVALTKAVLPQMIRRKSGHIVVVSSLAGKIGTPGRAAYSASKHALHGFFDSLRAEVWRDHIKVTLVCPGFVRTNFRANALDGGGATHGARAVPHRQAMGPDTCAAEILSAIIRGKEEIYVGRQRFAIYAYRFFPGLVSQVIRRVTIL